MIELSPTKKTNLLSTTTRLLFIITVNLLLKRLAAFSETLRPTIDDYSMIIFFRSDSTTFLLEGCLEPAPEELHLQLLVLQA